MNKALPNPIDVFVEIADERDWEYEREEHYIFFSATLSADESKMALNQVKWFPEEGLVMCAAIWSYEHDEVDHLQMHRATASVNEEMWQGNVYWNETQKCMVLKMGVEAPDGKLEKQAAIDLHETTLVALNQLIPLFNSYRDSDPGHTALLLDADLGATPQ